MKNIITLIFLVISLASSAQKIRFTDNHNKWVTLGYTTDYAPFQASFFYDADTIAYGRLYKSMHNHRAYFYCESWVGGSCPGLSGGPIVHFLIREDTIAGKIYYRDISMSSTDTLEHLLYNYNFNVGDTINFSGLTDTVASIDSTIINGVYHKIIYMRNNLYGRSYTVLEGVGCTNSPLFPAYFVACFEYGEALTCFSQSGIYPVIPPISMNTCAAFTTFCCISLFIDSFDNVSKCGQVLSEKKVKTNNLTFRINPNPTYDHIDVTSSMQFDNNTFISVYDVTGRRVYNMKADEDKTTITINTFAWNSGMYMVVIQNPNGVIKREKIVVLK